MSSVFLSYRRSDSPDAVARIYERLCARLRNREVFYDHESIELGNEFLDLLRNKVGKAGVVLAIIGPNWVELLHERKTVPVDHVRNELSLALASKADVIPVLVGRAKMPTESDLAEFPELLPLLRKNAQPVSPDPDFDAECERLIQHLERTGPSEIVGSVLGGKYKVQRQIGEGGMGDVYIAEQTQPVRRLVAIKLIKPGMDSREILGRFDAERQALAVMDHPNVCRVLDAGAAPNGRPFFVMEFVKGVPITQFCDDRKLTPKARLELFITVCKAVQHAHQKGIIHRDIKPGNILVEIVDSTPVPKVIDFGLAKALGQKLTDKTYIATEYGKWVGTLEYSSPEQAEGRFDIDTLSDVYSLGVLLYELLAGSPPFTRAEILKASEDEVRRLVREAEPPKPSTKLSTSRNLPAIAAHRQLDPVRLKKIVRGDLDWIVMKTLEKDPDHRYATPTALADDIERYLSNEPITAGKPTALHRLAKFYRRHRGPVLAGCAVFLALSGGIVSVSVEKRRTDLALAQKQLALEDAERERQNAIQSSTLAAKRLDEKRSALDEMLGTFSDDRLKLLPGSQQIRQAFFEKGLEEYAQILHERQNDPLVQARLADSYRELGMLQGELGAPTEALSDLQKAVLLRRQTAAAAPQDPAAAMALGRALFEVGQFCFEQRRTKEAAAPVQESVDIFARLVARYPDGAAYKAGLGRGLTRLASVKADLGQEKTLRRARALLQEAAPRLPADADVLTDLARALNNLGASLEGKVKNSSEVFELYDQARKTAEKALALNPSHSLAQSIRLQAIQNRAVKLAVAGRSTESVQLLAEALSESKTFARKNPAVIRAVFSQVELQDELARRYQQLSKLDEAVAGWQEIARLEDGLVQRYPDNETYQIKRIEALFSVCDIEMGRSRLSNASNALDRVIVGADDAIRLYPRSPRVLGRLVRAYYFRGLLADRQQRTPEALRFSQDGLALFEHHRALKGGDVDPPYEAFLCTVQGTACAKKVKDLSLAVTIAERGGAIAESFNTAPMQRERLDLLVTLAECCEQTGATEKVVRVWKQARDEAARLVNQTSFDFRSRIKLKESLQQLTKLYRRNNDLHEEIETARALLKVWSYFDGKDYSKVLEETAAINEGTAERLRRLLQLPPRMISIHLPTQHYITESLQLFEDQVRWMKDVQGTKFPEDLANSYRKWHKQAVEHKVSFVDLCSYSDGVGTIDDENTLKITRALDEIAKLTRQLDATPGEALRRRLAESYTVLAEEYSSHPQSDAASSRAMETAINYLDLSPAGEPRHSDDRRILARLRFLEAKLAGEEEKYDRAYASLLTSLRLFPETVRTDGDTDERRCKVGQLCIKAGRQTEAAQWFLTAAELGDASAVAALCQLYLEEPAIGAVLPRLLVEDLEALRQSTPVSKKTQKTLNQLRDVWKKYRVQVILAGPALRPVDKGRLLGDLDAFEQAETILNEALKTSPKDVQLQSELAECYRKRASSLYNKEMYSEAATAYRRSLEMGGDSEYPDLLANYLRTLIVSGRTNEVEAQANRFLRHGPIAGKAASTDPAWNHVAWGLCAIAAALRGEDYAVPLAKASTAAPVIRISWHWESVREWPGMASLSPQRKKTLERLVSELQSVMIDARAGRNASVFDKIIGDEYAVLLLRGANTRGDMIYTYVRVGLTDIPRLYTALHSGKQFNATDYGVVLAAGKDEPPVDVSREVARKYPAFSLVPTTSFGRGAVPLLDTTDLNPYLSAVSHGMHLFREGNYEKAIPHLKAASAFQYAVADDYTQLGACYGRLGRWGESLVAHKKGVEHEATEKTGCMATLHFLEAFALSDRPAEAEAFVSTLVAKKWQPREETINRLNQASAMFYGLQAVAQRMLGKDARELEKKMRQYTVLTRMETTDWDWQDIDSWLKATKLPLDRKRAIEQIVADLQGKNKVSEPHSK